MAALSNIFTIEKYGVDAPCRLMYQTEEMLHFGSGLKGKISFTEKYARHEAPLKRFGILIPTDPEASDTLKSLVGKNVVLGEEGFGEAFYRYYFPKISKGHPERYTWEVLSSK